jgi:phosphohistidine phosphatase SixA
MHTMSPAAFSRRILLASTLAAWPLARAQAARDGSAFATLLAAGGCAVLIRHAQTEPGIGDPPGFTLEQCSSQRQLSAEGRESARRIGQWFQARSLAPSEVRSSQWCRCKDTAELAFGRASAWTALNSTFGNSSLQPAQTQELRQTLRQIAAGKFVVWVTHQVNMTHLTQEYPAMGEAFVVDASARLRARMSFA